MLFQPPSLFGIMSLGFMSGESDAENIFRTVPLCVWLMKLLLNSDIHWFLAGSTRYVSVTEKISKMLVESFLDVLMGSSSRGICTAPFHTPAFRWVLLGSAEPHHTDRNKCSKCQSFVTFPNVHQFINLEIHTLESPLLRHCCIRSRCLLSRVSLIQL